VKAPVEDPATAGLRRQVAEMRTERDDARQERDDNLVQAHQALAKVRHMQPLVDRWERIAELIDAWQDGADPHDTLTAIAEQVGDR
jgi:hypothetical protein